MQTTSSLRRSASGKSSTTNSPGTPETPHAPPPTRGSSLRSTAARRSNQRRGSASKHLKSGASQSPSTSSKRRMSTSRTNFHLSTSELRRGASEGCFEFSTASNAHPPTRVSSRDALKDMKGLAARPPTRPSRHNGPATPPSRPPRKDRPSPESARSRSQTADVQIEALRILMAQAVSARDFSSAQRLKCEIEALGGDVSSSKGSVKARTASTSGRDLFRFANDTE